MISNIIQKAILFFIKRKVVKNYKKYCKKRIGYALLFFKTDAFFLESLAEKYHHVNFWETLEIAKILNRIGYYVDIIDRTVDLEKIELQDKYDIFIGISGGMSGKNFPKISSKLTKAVKVAFMSSQDPKIFNEAVLKRYKDFEFRNKGINLPMVGLKVDIDMEEIINNTNVIFCEGEKLTLEQYKKYNKPVYQIYVPSSPKIIFNLPEIYNRSKKKFLYFGSNRNILKGLDLLIESFLQLPELELYICTPANEPEFNQVYANRLNNVKNIHWVGFVDVGGKKFEQLVKQCAFVTLLSCSDSMATSVTSCMRKGMIPVITPETDVSVDNFGFLIKNVSIENIKNEFYSISQTPDEEILTRSVQSYMSSQKYTQEEFSKSFENSLIDVLLRHKLKNKNNEK